MPRLLVVVRLMALCNERYTWSRRENNKKRGKKLSEVFFLTFRLNRKLCIFLCTKCTDAMHSSFCQLSAAIHPKQLGKKKRQRTLSCFIVCVHHSMFASLENVGDREWEVWRSGNASKELLRVSGLCRECVCRLHKFVQLAITAKIKRVKTVHKRKSVPFKKGILWTWTIMSRFLAIVNGLQLQPLQIISQADKRKSTLLLSLSACKFFYIVWKFLFANRNCLKLQSTLSL